MIDSRIAPASTATLYWSAAVGDDETLDSCKALQPLLDGNLSFVDGWGQTVTIPVKAGVIIPVCARSLVAAGSTSFPIVVLG